MVQKLTIRDLPIEGKKVLMRVDFNAPIDENGEVSDDTRIRAALPSIRYVLDHGGSLILMSHLGRPKQTPSPEFSLASCAKRLGELLKKEVDLTSDCIGTKAKQMCKKLKPGHVLLLENLRFHRGEEYPKEDPSFTEQLASLGDYYVNDAFGTAHRAHASTSEIARYFPGKAAMGFLMEKELRFLDSALKNPERPFYAILGGAKISTKLGVIRSLLNIVDALLIGGGMSYTFFKAQGIPTGNSLCEDSFVEEAKKILEQANKRKIPFLLPQDHIITDNVEKGVKSNTVNSASGIPQGFIGVDIGPSTIKQYVNLLQNAKTVFWNGPMGVFEKEQFAEGTQKIAHALANLHAITIVGGGESIAAVEAAGVADKISHISTGGGATLEYIEFGTLPGIEALSNATETVGTH